MPADEKPGAQRAEEKRQGQETSEQKGDMGRVHALRQREKKAATKNKNRKRKKVSWFWNKGWCGKKRQTGSDGNWSIKELTRQSPRRRWQASIGRGGKKKKDWWGDREGKRWAEFKRLADRTNRTTGPRKP